MTDKIDNILFIIQTNQTGILSYSKNYQNFFFFIMPDILIANYEMLTSDFKCKDNYVAMTGTVFVGPILKVFFSLEVLPTRESPL